MSININVGGMNYNQLSCAQRAEIDKKRKNRLTQVCLLHIININIDFLTLQMSFVGQRTIEGNRPAGPFESTMRKEESIEKVSRNKTAGIGEPEAKAM
jgi:hypothetical protein